MLRAVSKPDLVVLTSEVVVLSRQATQPVSFSHQLEKSAEGPEGTHEASLEPYRAQVATSVAPFQLTYTLDVPLGKTATSGRVVG